MRISKDPPELLAFLLYQVYFGQKADISFITDSVDYLIQFCYQLMPPSNLCINPGRKFCIEAGSKSVLKSLAYRGYVRDSQTGTLAR